ncbi:MAG: DUF4157 domain-containing protein [Dehalococcoidia bacterium]
MLIDPRGEELAGHRPQATSGGEPARPTTSVALSQLQNAAGNRAVQRMIQRSVLTAHPEVEDGAAANEPGFMAHNVRLPPPGGGKKLPPILRRHMEMTFGANFSRIRIHQGKSAAQMNALAYTLGRDIHFLRGRYVPHTQSGQRLIAHELAHTVQQFSGRVDAPRGDGVPVNTERHLESEADRLARHATWGLPVHVRGSGSRTAKPASPTVQRHPPGA